MPDKRERVRDMVRDRAGGNCEYCRSQERFSADSFSVDHINPRARGGGHESGNLALSCQGCNNLKSASVDGIDPVTGSIAPLFHPRSQRWIEHFAWSTERTHVIGITPTGRATVAKLQLNREPVVNFRRILVTAGEHPPPG